MKIRNHSFIVPVLILTFLLAPGPATVFGQDVAPGIAVLNVDSDHFPLVNVTLAVTNPSGPIADLNSSKFTLTEDGKPVSAEGVTLLPKNDQPIRIMLGLDTSMDKATWGSVQQAAGAFLSHLGPDDEVALVAFSSSIRTVRDFTKDKQLLQSDVASLKNEGDKTLLNQALTTMLAMLKPVSTRQAVILLTNTGENGSSDSVTPTILPGVPVFALVTDFYKQYHENGLQALMQSTGGNLFIAAAADKLADGFQSVSNRLKQGGYMLRFLSGLKATGAQHTLTLTLTQDKLIATAKASFTAQGQPVTVSILNLKADQDISGDVLVTVNAQAPAPIAFVHILLDGDSLAQFTAAPYQYHWDSVKTPPGIHQLTAEVQDQAGNRGNQSLNLKVSPPISAQMTSSAAKIKSGEDATFNLEITSIAKIAKVEFYIDKKLAGSVTAAPYHWTLSNKGLKTGFHAVQAVITDADGNNFSVDSQIEIQPSRALTVAQEIPWTKVAIVAAMIIGALFLLAVWTVLLVAFVRWQKRRLKNVVHLELANLGNTRCMYQLHAEDSVNSASGSLKFSFAYAGKSFEQVVPTPPAQPRQKPQKESRPASAALKDNSPSVLDKASMIGDGLASIGTLLGPAGGAIWQAGAQIRGRSEQAERVTKMPEVAMQRVNTAFGTKLAPGTIVVQPGSSQFGGMSTFGASASEIASEPMPWILTPSIAPGESLSVDLIVEKSQPFRAAPL